MTRRTPAEVEAKIVASLELGRSMPDVARQFHLDLSTVKRIKKRYGVSLGGSRVELVEEARQEARQALEQGWIKEQVAILIRDDIAQSHQLREHINKLLETMPKPSGIGEFGQVARSLTAISAALKNTSDLSHKSLAFNRDEVEQEGLPELVVTELSTDEVEAMRRRQDEEGDIHKAEAA